MSTTKNNYYSENALDKDIFLTVPELACRYRTSSPMIYRWISERRFPEKVVFRLGRKILIHKKNLETFESTGGIQFD